MKSSEEIIGSSIKIGNIEIAQHDFPYKLDWFEAQKACQSLGHGWRLPTKYELNILYQNKIKIGGFVPNLYWSSDRYDASYAWVQDFANGEQDYYMGPKEIPIYFRVVKAF